jgi:segregation and condensation protein B
LDPELARKVEAVLFASGRFMDVTRIAELLETNPKLVEAALRGLRQSYADAGSALRVIEEDKAWKLHVQDEYLDLVSKIVSDTEISGPVLETLAVVAWRSPILQAEVVNIRGSNAYEHIKELVERGFMRKDPSGRSFELRITEKFFEYFDIEGREDIRKVFREVEDAHRKKEMEMELAQKRLDQAMRRAEGEEVLSDAPLDEPDAVRPPDEEATGAELQTTVRPNLDELDAVLEKSAKRREQVAAEMAELRQKDVPAPVDGVEAEEASEGVDEQEIEDPELEESRRVREKVERDADDIARGN